MASPAQKKASNSASAIERWHGPDDPRVAQLRAEAKALALEEHIRKVVESAPPLSSAQRNDLALLLRGDAA